MKKLISKFDINVEITDTGYSAYLIISVNESIFTTGENIDELLKNLVESINFLFEEKNQYIDRENLTLNLDFKQFFEFYKVLNAKYLAERIGMNPSLLSQYINGKKLPSEKQKIKLLLGLNTIGNELIQLKYFH
jgi:transcriptional regulator with XRE-family HTH domain